MVAFVAFTYVCACLHCTVIREVFVFRNFHVINFCVEIFLWSGATMKIHYHEIYSHMLRKWRIEYEGDLCVRGFHVVSRSQTAILHRV